MAKKNGAGTAGASADVSQAADAQDTASQSDSGPEQQTASEQTASPDLRASTDSNIKPAMEDLKRAFTVIHGFEYEGAAYVVDQKLELTYAEASKLSETVEGPSIWPVDMEMPDELRAKLAQHAAAAQPQPEPVAEVSADVFFMEPLFTIVPQGKDFGTPAGPTVICPEENCGAAVAKWARAWKCNVCGAHGIDQRQ